MQIFKIYSFQKKIDEKEAERGLNFYLFQLLEKKLYINMMSNLEKFQRIYHPKNRILFQPYTIEEIENSPFAKLQRLKIQHVHEPEQQDKLLV